LPPKQSLIALKTDFICVTIRLYFQEEKRTVSQRPHYQAFAKMPKTGLLCDQSIS